MIRDRYIWSVAALVLTVASLVLAQPKDAVDMLRKSQTGERVLAYVEAFNTGDTAVMRRFFEANLSAEGKSARPVEVRVNRYREISREIRSMTLKEVRMVTDSLVVIIASNANQELMRMEFGFEAEPPHFLAGIAIELMEEPVSAEPETPLTLQEAVDRIHALVDSLAGKDEFSGNVLVTREEKPLARISVGMADAGLGVPVNDSTKFNLGSINKIFTKIAIGQLLQQGKLSIDSTFGAYLKDYPNPEIAGKVTIRQLLEMTSGIPDFFGEEFEQSPKDRFRTTADYIPLFANKPLWFEPGTDRRYSNGSYILLGAVIEAVTGISYYDYVREHVFRPAGMTNTDSYALDEIVPNRAVGWTTEGGNGSDKRHANIYTLPARGSAAGGGYSTTDDLRRFILALRDGKLLDGKYTSWILTGEYPHAETEEPVLPLTSGGMGIAGGSSGVNGVVECDLMSNTIIIVLSNYDPPSAERLGAAIRRILSRVQ